MSIQHEDAIVAIAQKSGSSGENFELFAERFTPLAAELALGGIRTIGLNGRTDNVLGTPMFTRYYEFANGSVNPVDGSVLVHAALDRTGGIARYVPSVSALNPLSIRDAVASKANQYEILRSLGPAVPVTLRAPAVQADVEALFDAVETEELIIKPDKDPDKKYPIITGDKSTVRSKLWRLLGQLSPTQEVIVQEYMPEVHEPFAPQLVFSALERAITKQQQVEARELRIHTIDNTIVAAHARVGLSAANGSPHDTWAFFEQESLPEHIRELVGRGTQLLRAYTQTEDSHLAWDITPDGNRIVEVNGRTIGTMAPDLRRPLAHEVHVRTTRGIAMKLSEMSLRASVILP